MMVENRASCVAALIMKLRARDDVDEREAQALADSVSEVREFGPGKVMVRSGTRLEVSMLLTSGIVSRYKDLAGGERQIQELHVSGDFVDLHGFLLKQLDHNVGAVSACRVALVTHERLRRITEEHPHLSRLLWFSTVLDAAIQRETILSIGRRSALSRIAHLMCELSVRLRVVGESDGRRFALPMTQLDLADATGLTSVHVNRMLKQLRDQELLTFRGGEVVIEDWDRLVRTAEFDADYLHLQKLPR